MLIFVFVLVITFSAAMIGYTGRLSEKRKLAIKLLDLLTRGHVNISSTQQQVTQDKGLAQNHRGQNGSGINEARAAWNASLCPVNGTKLGKRCQSDFNTKDNEYVTIAI